MFVHTNVCTGIELETSCVVGEYSHHFARSAVVIESIIEVKKPQEV
jgi:hypothetical protein